MKKLILLSVAMCAMVACGVKPGEIEPPEAVKNKEFPRTYPDIMTTPPPYVPPANR